jgi:recombination protein RecT
MAETVSQAVATIPKGIEIARKNRERFAAVLPRHIEERSYVGMAEAALYRDPKLMEAAANNPQEFFGVLMRCASLGHRPGSDEFYMVPRKKKGRLEVQGIEGYRGIVERMYRSGAVGSVIVREVCDRDEFRFIEGEMDKPHHRVDWFGTEGRGDMIGVYAYAVMTTGAVSRVVILSKADVMAAKAKSDGASSEYSPWNALDGGPERPEFRGRSMWWKTAARRLEPWVPTSVEFFKERVRAAAEVNHTTVERPTDPAHTRVDTETGEIHDAEIVEEPQDQSWPKAAQPGGAE